VYVSNCSEDDQTKAPKNLVSELERLEDRNEIVEEKLQRYEELFSDVTISILNYVTKVHNKIQEVLQQQLEQKYGIDNVVLEENYVDIKVKLKNEIHFYEVKSSAFAADCIREGLGQIMSYMQKDDDDRTKILFIAGQYAPNQDEIDYLNFVKRKLKIDFDYVSVELKD
jgi:hypothetical protein